MAIISKEGLLKVLVSYNPWWKTGVVNPKLSKTYKRFAFYEAMKRLNQTDIRRTVVLTGTRRVGKTTIQYQMIEALLLLREEYHFAGYIHAKAIPGADAKLLQQLGMLADRMSVNIELPSQQSLKLLAPDKSKQSIFTPMGFIRNQLRENASDLVKYHHAPKFAPAGQSTQMIIGATPDTDYQILNLTEGLYQKYKLKRVFYSAYLPVNESALLPPIGTKPPLLREHRLYQADWLLRFYGFKAKELLDEQHQSFHPYLDPKCNWALNHLDLFPVEVNKASYETLLRVPGIGVKGAKKIITARRTTSLTFQDLKRLGVVLKRAQYFLLCKGKMMEGVKVSEDMVLRSMMSDSAKSLYYQYQMPQSVEQLSFFEQPKLTQEDVQKCLTGQL